MLQKSRDDKKYNSAQHEQYYGVGGFVLEIIKIIALAFVIIIPIRVFLFQPFFVQGASMEPNFEDGQYLIVNEFGYKETPVGFGEQAFFSVEPFKTLPRQVPIVFRYPLDPSKYFIKRIIGLPGEKVQIKNNQVTISNHQYPNGFVLDESAYLSSSVRTDRDVSIMLKDDEYFVMGDNRPYSSDSRSWGPVPGKDIIGRVEVRAWPLDKLSIY